MPIIGCGNNIDHSYYYTWDSNNNELSQTFIYNSNLDLTPDREITYTYDVNGNRESYIIDNNNNGIGDTIFTYKYDDNSNMLKTTENYNNEFDPELDRSVINTYDIYNNWETSRYDSDGDGSINQVFTYEYNENGNRLKEIIDSNTETNPEPDAIITYTYTSSTWVGIFGEIH